MSISKELEAAVLNFPVQIRNREEVTILLKYSPIHYAKQIKLKAISYLQDIQQGKYKLIREGILWLRTVNELLQTLGYEPVTNYQFLGASPLSDFNCSNDFKVLSLPVPDQQRFRFPVKDEERFDFLAAYEDAFLQREKIKKFLKEAIEAGFPIDDETVQMVKGANKTYDFFGFLPIKIPELTSSK